MTDTIRHVVFREDQTSDGRPEWSSYSMPTSVYAGGNTLFQAREEFRDAARFGIDDFDQQPAPTEHLERLLVDGVHVRTAVGRQMLDRDAAVATLRRALTDPAQRAELQQRAPLAGGGDIVIVACVPTDTVGWIVEQMSPREGLVVCAQIGDLNLLLWSYLAGGEAEVGDVDDTETIAEGGLTLDSTIAQLLLADADTAQRRVHHLVAAG